MRGTMLSFAVCAAAVVSLDARGGERSALDDAKVLIREGKPLEAAGRFGDAAAAAHRSGDLGAEQDAAEALRSAMDGVATATPADAVAGTTGTKPTRASLLAAVLAKLDAKRAGAFVSAPCLARRLVLEATETGDRAFVRAARPALAANASQGKGGRAAAAFLKYADALLALDADEKGASKAPALLRETFDEAVERKWPELAVHAGSELALTSLTAGDTAGAAATLRTTLAALDTARDSVPLMRWRSWIRVRTKDAPKDVLDALGLGGDLAESGGAGGAGGAGGKGGKGGAGGRGADGSPYGRWAARARKSEAVVRAKLGPSGFEMRLGWTDGAAGSQPIVQGCPHWNRDGVTLAFDGRAVCVRMLDPTGLAGQPGESSEASVWSALHLVAEGETWSLLRDGTVTVTAK